MAAPASATGFSIIVAALEQANAIEKVGRARNWLREIMLEISRRKDLKLFEATKIGELKKYQARYALPVDLDKILSLHVLYGETTGQAQAGVASSITLASTTSISADFAKGKEIFILSGAAAYQAARITAYDENTKVATVSPDWSTTPGVNDYYMIAETERRVYPKPREEISNVASVDVPLYYHVFGRESREIYFDAVVDTDNKYVMRLRYELFTRQIDLESSTLTQVYDEMEDILIQGVYVYALRDKADEQYPFEMQMYERKLKDFFIRDSRERLERNRGKVRSIGGMPL